LLAAVAMFAHWRRVERDAAISGQMEGAAYAPPRDWSVVVGEHEVRLSVEPDGGALRVCEGGRRLRVESGWGFNDLMFCGRIDDAEVCMQIERRGLRYVITHFGLQIEAMVMSARAAAMLARM